MTLSTAVPAELDRSLEDLHAGSTAWAALPAAEIIPLLDEVRLRVAPRAHRWVDSAAAAKGLAPDSPLVGEEWISGPWALIYALNRYLRTLRECAATGMPQLAPGRIRERPDGRVVVDVFPAGLYDRLLLSGVSAEVWMQRDVTRSSVGASMKPFVRYPTHDGRVALVLGAGNIAAIPPLDVLYKMLADGCVCVLKMNPVNAYLGPIFEEIFAPLIARNFLRVVYGGADVGQYLCSHPRVDEIHITGSATTHDAIVFGTGPDAAERKRRDDPVLAKPITSELGNVSPTIVVPGTWSAADLRFQAEQIVTQKMHNAGCNCIAAQVVILPRDWSQTGALVDAIETAMRELADRPAYYPGAAQRAAAMKAGGDAKHFGREDGGFVARTIVHLDAHDVTAAGFTTEVFSSVLVVTTLPGDTEAYLEAAVAFANDRLSGSLGANLIVHPATERTHRAAVDRAIAGLAYGCVAVNAWTGVGFLLTETTWGAFPGHVRNDVRSGIGVVHNSHFFSRAEKSVVRAPFAPFPRSLFGYGATLLPKPPWFVTNRNAAKIGAALVGFESAPSPIAAAKIALLAMLA